MLPEDTLGGRRRVIVEGLRPEVDGGRYAAKRVLGDRMVVEADLLVDGHEILAGVLRYGKVGHEAALELPLEPLVNDRYRASFALDAIGRWHYTVEAWIDVFATWRWGLERKAHAGQDVSVELMAGAELVVDAQGRARGADADALGVAAKLIMDSKAAQHTRVAAALDADLLQRMARYPDRSLTTTYRRVLEVIVDPVRARYSTWYELFPRSAGVTGKHGTFKDVEARLPYIAGMGFDVLYLPPIHPIGKTNRKGRNNTLEPGPGDVGSPWAIGASEGGHKAIHPELGTMADFKHLVTCAREMGIEVALDIAFQVSPDHPYVKDHPEWFVHRADGTIQYAENPPKKYQDVYPFDIAGESWKPLWNELKSVFEHWIAAGVTIFRVDNPHTKPLPFWEWCITAIKAEHPECLFLAEAFTRPKIMYSLAKAGFSQSYTYFTWRDTKWDLTEYMKELTRSEVADFFRPNLWPNTPDILPEHLQFGGRPAFLRRLILAGTLSSSYGIYGPPYELMEHVARPGVEEYIDNEKYQLRAWDLENPSSLRFEIQRLNEIRRDNPALHDNASLRFHKTDNENVLCYSKAAGGDLLIIVVNMDQHTHGAWLELDLAVLGLRDDETFQAHDLLGDSRYSWRGGRNFVRLDPHVMPAHIFRVRRHLTSEQNFEYFI